MGIKVLSLYDGMSCGNIAFKNLGVEVDKYISYEIDKYAIAVTQHNFPDVIQMGDVYGADFTQYEGFDWLIGGFPCTKFSIAQKNGREIEPYSGLGWELFMHYKRALNEAKPKYFLAENNKSMAKPIRDEISRLFGFEPICINSSLVSAQNRQRLYWVGIRQPDGTYRKADIEQPEDRGILLRDVLDGYAVGDTHEKAYVLSANYANGSGEKIGNYAAHTLTKGCKTMVAEPVCVAQRGRYADSGNRYTKSDAPTEQFYEARMDGKTNAITTVQKDNAVAEPVRVGCYPSPDGTLKNSQGMRLYDINAKPVNLTAQGGGMGAKTGLYAVPVGMAISDEYFKGGFDGELIGMIESNSVVRNGKQPPQWTRIYTCDGKSVCIDTDQRKYCIMQSDGKTQPIYQVLNGLITIKDKQYPIKLADGYYIIRKLTVSECKRLQTVPDWYDFSVISNSQAYKCLGNAWTVDVIVHLIESAVNT